MLRPTKHLILAAFIATTAGHAQQSPSPQPPQTQVKPAVPCTTVPAKPQDPRLITKPKSKWRQIYDQKMAEIQANTGIVPPDVAAEAAAKVNETLHPCPAPETPKQAPVTAKQ
jgi:hypothetical protein